VSITLSPVRDADGAVIGVSKIAHDISEQMASVAAARESTGLLKVLIEEAPTGLAMFDREMRMLACSKRWKFDRGLSDIEAVGWTHAELDPTIPEHWREEERRALAGETVVSPQDFYKRHDGQVRWLSQTLRPWMTGTGEIGGIVILSEDITERKLAETALAEEAARTRLLFERAIDSIFLLDHEFRVAEANASFAALLGRPLDEVLGLHPWDWDPGQFSKDAFAAFAAMLSRERNRKRTGVPPWCGSAPRRLHALL
jgi:PAS domain S-box-containing protein